jgi:hypothetical protein
MKVYKAAREQGVGRKLPLWSHDADATAVE